MKNYNLLITKGDISSVKDHAKFGADIWIHNGSIEKNLIPEALFNINDYTLTKSDKPNFEIVFNEIVEINKIDPADHSQRLAKLFEESGELAKEINKITGRKVLSDVDTTEVIKQNICDEAADTIQNVISLVEAFGITSQDVVDSIAKGNAKWVKNVEKRKAQNV
jgi:NTP pyrophosphatase (non-canonical NTP hydrolase)